MDGLRWLLLLFGVLVVAGVYVYSRRERAKRSQDPVGSPRHAPIIADETDDSATGTSPESGAQTPEQLPQKIVTLRLVARENSSFRGDELLLNLRGIGMRPGKFGIYHRHDGNDESRVVFSAASLVEPGSFDIENIKDQEIPGISLFCVLPGPIDGAEAFDMMMTAAKALAQSMNAELLDESGSSLSVQRERYIREDIIQFQHSNLVA